VKAIAGDGEGGAGDVGLATCRRGRGLFSQSRRRRAALPGRLPGASPPDFGWTDYSWDAVSRRDRPPQHVRRARIPSANSWFGCGARSERTDAVNHQTHEFTEMKKGSFYRRKLRELSRPNELFVVDLYQRKLTANGDRIPGKRYAPSFSGYLLFKRSEPDSPRDFADGPLMSIQ